MKVTREHGRASYVGEVRMMGPGFNHRNDSAVGVAWAAERIAIAYIDANALAQASAP